MTSDDDYQTPSMSRREALAGGSAAAVAVGAGLMSNSLVRRAQAQLSDGDARIVMGDQGESPAQNGVLTHNTGDVEVYSGGSVRNLTDPTFGSVTTPDVTINNSVTYPDGTTYTTHPNVDGTDISPSSVANEAILYGSDSPGKSGIETALSNNDRVILVGDHTSLSDKINATADTTLIIGTGATLSFADTATPTSVAAGPNDEYLIHADGVDGFSVIVDSGGVLDANNTNITNSAPVLWDGSTTTINSGFFHMEPGANITDSSDGVYLESCNNVNIGRVYSDDVVNAVVAYGGCTDISIGWAKTVDAAEAIDINGSNTDCDVGVAIGDNCSQEIIDMNGSDRITIGEVRGVNTPLRGVRIDGGDNITVGSIVGRYGDQALLTTVGPAHTNVHAHLNAISANTRCVYIRGSAAGDLDGLRLSGYAESESASKACRIDPDNAGNNVKSEDCHLNLELVSGDSGLEIYDFDYLSGTVHAHDCGTRGVRIRGACSHGDLTVLAHDNTAGWDTRLNSSVSDFTIRGWQLGNNLRVEGTDIRVDMYHPGGLADAGTRTRVHGVAQESLTGSAPATPANWSAGEIVEDTDNAGDAYLKLPSSGFAQIST